MNNEDIFDTAVRYRQALEKIQKMAFTDIGCQCKYKPDWQTLMDNGVNSYDPELLTDGKLCFACKVQQTYEEALGSEAFYEQVMGRLDAFMKQNFKEPVIVPVYNEDGSEDEVIVEREDFDRFVKKFNEGNL